MYIEESFDTIFNMGYGGGLQDPPPHALCVGKITHAFKDLMCFRFRADKTANVHCTYSTFMLLIKQRNKKMQASTGVSDILRFSEVAGFHIMEVWR